MTRPSLSVIGLGKLGSPFAAVMSAKGFKVIGVDKNPIFVRAINAGKAPVEEPLLRAFIKRGRARLSATTKLEEAVLASNISFIIVPTPSGPDGTFTNKFVLEAVKGIAKVLPKKKTRHVIVVTSTVMPGSSESVIYEAIEKASGLKMGKDVGYCYNPEFIALGNVIEDMLFPDFILIGESDARSGKAVADVYRKVCGKDVQIERMKPVNAEITKLSINTFVTAKISYANMLADICERLPGADVDVVSRAVGTDTRVGRKYLKGATAYGGPCFPRDNIALASMAKRLGARVDLPNATDRINDYQTERLMKKIRKSVPKGGVVGLAGMAYKPDTPVIERAAGMALAEKLLKERYTVRITDPLAAKAARAKLKGRVSVVDDIAALAKHVDVLVVLVPCAPFKKLSARHISARKKPLVILDCWRIYKDAKLGKKAELIYVGKSA